MLNQLDRIGKLALGLAIIGLVVVVGSAIIKPQAMKVRRMV